MHGSLGEDEIPQNFTANEVRCKSLREFKSLRLRREMKGSVHAKL